MLIGAIMGAIIGLLVVVFSFFAKEQRFNKVLKTITDPVEYAALYHYASARRYKNSYKFFDSYGVLYLVGKTLYYKTTPTATPLAFDLNTCMVQAEADWRWMKWFSVTTATGEKYYFNSNKMGVIKNNSDETLKGLELIRAKMSS